MLLSDPMEVAPADLSEVRVTQTWLDGTQVYQRPPAAAAKSARARKHHGEGR